MSAFLDELHTTYLPEKSGSRPVFRLLHRFRAYSNVMHETVEVPAGFETDFASVPRMPLAYLYAGGKAPMSAVIHDYLYVTKKVSKEVADNVFYELLKVEGIGPIRRRLMYQAVSWFGGRRNPAQWLNDVLGG